MRPRRRPDRPRTARRAAHRSALALCGLALAGCAGGPPAKPVLLSSDPPGAIVRVDGERAGFATPCMISLPLERAHLIELEFPGYVTAGRYVVPDGYEEAVTWAEMNVGHRTPHFPLFLNIDDFFVTVVTKNPKIPGRIFVRMKRVVDLEEALGEEPAAAPAAAAGAEDEAPGAGPADDASAGGA